MVAACSYRILGMFYSYVDMRACNNCGLKAGPHYFHWSVTEGTHSFLFLALNRQIFLPLATFNMLEFRMALFGKVFIDWLLSSRKIRNRH